MAVLPTAKDLGFVTPQADRPLASYRGGIAEEGQIAEGQGIATLGQDIEKGANQIQIVHDQIATDDALVQFQNASFNRLYGDPNNPNDHGYYGTKGKDALTSRQPLLDNMEQDRQAIRAGLGSDFQKIAFDNASRRLYAIEQERAGTHSLQQANVYGQSVQTAHQDMALKEIGKSASDDAMFGASLIQGQRAARNQAMLAGDAPEMADAKAADFTSKAYATRAHAIGIDSPIAALEFVRKNRDNMDAGTAAVLVNHFEPLAIERTGQDIADKATGAGGPVRAAGSNTGPIANANLPAEAHKFLPALSGGEGNYGSPAPQGDRSGSPIRNNRYQFLNSTWQQEAPKAGINVNDHSPEAQDTVAWNYAGDVYRKNTGRNLQADVAEGGHEGQIATALNKVWTSLPGGPEQNTSLAQFVSRMGGSGSGGPVLTSASTGGDTGVTATPAGLSSAPGAPERHPEVFGLEAGMIDSARQMAREQYPNDPRFEKAAVAATIQRIQLTNLLQAKQEAAQAKQTKDAVIAGENEYIPQIITDPTKVDPTKIAADPRFNADPQTRWRLNQMLQTALRDPEKPAALSHQIAIGLVDGIRRGIVTDMAPVYDAYKSGLSNTDFNFVQTQFKELQTTDGQRLDQKVSRFLDAVKSSVMKPTPLGTIDFTGGSNFFRLQEDIQSKIAKYRQQHKDPFDLFAPEKPDFVGRPEALLPYQSSIAEVFESYAARMRAQAAVDAAKKPRPPLSSILGPPAANPAIRPTDSGYTPAPELPPQ